MLRPKDGWRVEVARACLTIYLNDHRAGAQAALEILALLRKDADSEVWRETEDEIREDRAELRGS